MIPDLHRAEPAAGAVTSAGSLPAVAPTAASDDLQIPNFLRRADAAPTSFLPAVQQEPVTMSDAAHTAEVE